MKKTPINICLLLTISLMLLNGCSYIPEKNDLENGNIYGVVQKIEETNYYPIEKFGEITKGEVKYSPNNKTTEFNDRGYITEINQWHSTGDLRRKITFYYSYRDGSKNSITEINTYKSDLKLENKQTHNYDDNWNGVEFNSWDSDGNLVGKQTSKYDDKGDRIGWNNYSSDGSLKDKYTAKFNNNGNEIELIRWDSDGNLRWENFCKYDENGNKIEEYRYNSDGNLEWGNSYKYDENGNEIEECRYNSDGNLELKNSYKYEFDDQNNWIICIKYSQKKEQKPILIPETITERKIDYNPNPPTRLIDFLKIFR